MLIKNKTLLDLKNLLKELASSIKELKAQRKNPNIRQSDTQYSIWRIKRNYRHCLIAYCELRGLIREQIEKPAENNFPDENEIKRIKTIFLPVWKIETLEVTNV